MDGVATRETSCVAGRRPRPACRCARYPEPCTAAITQEDLLCDGCRPGQCGMVTEPDGRSWHLAFTDVQFRVVPAARTGLPAPVAWLPGALSPLPGKTLRP